MDCCNENSINICSFFGVLVSVLTGVFVGVLFALGFIPLINIAVWIALGLGVLVLILLVISVFLTTYIESYTLTKCLCIYTTFLLVGIIGTIISAIAALSIILIPLCIPSIALVAIGAFFFSLMLFGLVSFISCIVNRIYRVRRE